ncbi:hypothetical protein SynA1528_01859 [Synechococcus sp. A15-28]|nr:hypothetical protein SynA1528_01859 [Synechococcus sp. A15-28]
MVRWLGDGDRLSCSPPDVEGGFLLTTAPSQSPQPTTSRQGQSWKLA